jgi:hypothetical protein
MLVVLRPVGEDRHFIGECCIHGLMIGRAMEMFDRRECKERTFILVSVETS